MPASIVVGYDGSASAKAALERAARDAGDRATVVVVTAFEPPAEWLGHPYDQKAHDDHRGQAVAALQEAASSPALAGATVETELIAGRPAEVIATVARTRDAEEIVIGSRGLGPLRGALGSVAYRVLHDADRPVVVVPDTTSR
jgi:nucleotide-binding universal stress UspA family protein